MKFSTSTLYDSKAMLNGLILKVSPIFRLTVAPQTGA